MAIEQDHIFINAALLEIFNVLVVELKVRDSDYRYQHLNDKFEELFARAESDQATKDQQEAATRHIEAMAKGLPAFASGLRDAVQAFSSGDSFAGSAAVMDICSTLSSTIGSMISVAGGPPGALIGALFSIVSMILKMFVKEQKSLSVQLEDLMRGLKAEEEIDKLIAAQQAIRAFITTVNTDTLKWTLAEYEMKVNVIDGIAINAIRGAAAWINRPKNQELPLWGDVLAAQCQSYSLLKHSVTYAISNLDVEGDVKATSVAKLTAMYASNDGDQLRFLQEIQPAVRNRATLWHIGIHWDGTKAGEDAGPLYVRDTARGPWTNLGGMHRIVAVSRVQTKTSGPSDPKPYLAVFGLERADNPHMVKQRLEYRHRKNKKTFGLFGKWPLEQHSGWTRIENLEGCYDICATPGTTDGEVYVYAANGPQIDVYLHNGAPSGSSGHQLKLIPERSISVPTGYTVDSVRVVQKPRKASDTDRARVETADCVIYGGCNKDGNKALIWAQFTNGAGETLLKGHFESPLLGTVGMAADSKFLWLFSARAIYCTSHASVMTSVYRRLVGCEWAGYALPSEFPYGFHDLTACDDGTLTAVMIDKEDSKEGRPNIYEATPELTWTSDERSIIIAGTTMNNYGQPVATNGWVQANSGNAHRVYKQPIFCWPLLTGLERVLQTSEGEQA
jgi:hypothetical protein